MCHMSQVLKNGIGSHFSNKANICLLFDPSAGSWLADSWLEGPSADSQLTDIEMWTFHVTQSLMCHTSQVLKMLNKAKIHQIPSSAGGWLRADSWLGGRVLPLAAWIPAGAFPQTPLLLHPHSSNYFHTFFLWFPQNSCLSGAFPFLHPSRFAGTFGIILFVKSLWSSILCPLCLCQ